MKPLERAIAAIAPRLALKRAHARHVLAAYEAAKPSKRHKKSRDNSTGERQVVRDATATRAIARDLERNHDLVRGALVTLTRNIVGPSGISIEPMPRIGGDPGDSKYDDIDDTFARQLLNLWREWTRSPEVTRTLDWIQVQELACRSWLRDGEVFAQLVEGSGAPIQHASRVPLSLELLEADVVPLDHAGESPTIEAGIERNTWGQPTAFYVYKHHPGNGRFFSTGELKRVPADRMLHLAMRERLSGLRGISLLASSITRLLDLKDYEESERVAARIAAAIAAYVKRDVNMEWTPPPIAAGEEDKPRDFFLEAGAVFQDTLPGEEIEMLNPNRPNTALDRFRMSQLRAASRAWGLTYSAFAGDYDGTYSAQRQELVEGHDGYRMLTGVFVSRFVRPVWERFIDMAILSGRLVVPPHIRPETVRQAEFRGPAMPWIDPKKEADALVIMTRAGIRSMQQVIAERGGRLQDTYEQLARERRLADELGLVLESDARTAKGTAQPAPEEPDTGNNRTSTQDGDDGGSRSRGPRLRAIGNGDSA
jgi:lambda family phage portal protein